MAGACVPQVFRLLSIAAGRPGTPQCFLLTPKLLNDLPYSPEVKILAIVNGPNLQNVARPFSKARPSAISGRTGAPVHRRTDRDPRRHCIQGCHPAGDHDGRAASGQHLAACVCAVTHPACGRTVVRALEGGTGHTNKGMRQGIARVSTKCKALHMQR